MPPNTSSGKKYSFTGEDDFVIGISKEPFSKQNGLETRIRQSTSSIFACS